MRPVLTPANQEWTIDLTNIFYGPSRASHVLHMADASTDESPALTERLFECSRRNLVYWGKADEDITQFGKRTEGSSRNHPNKA
jgi:hypothetical protein